MTQDERRWRIVAAAEETFTTKGYAAASMDDVGRACGMSKKTVYETFDTKEQLFHEVVASSVEDAPRLSVDEAGPAGSGTVLRDLLRDMAALILSPRQVALTRLVLAESPSSPELGAIFFETAVVQGQAILAETIRRIGGFAAVDGRQSGELADLLMGSLIGPRFFSALLGQAATPSEDEIHARIDWLLEILGPTLGLRTVPPFPEADGSRPNRDP